MPSTLLTCLSRARGRSFPRTTQWQRTLIIDHVMVIEPRARPPMRIFTAPANTEVEVARNAQDLTWAIGGKGSVDTEGMKSVEVGYAPELYEKGEKYFYTRKNPDGTSKTPAKDVQIESAESMVKAGKTSKSEAPPAGESSGAEAVTASTGEAYDTP